MGIPNFAQNRFARAGAAAAPGQQRPRAPTSRFAGVNSADANGSRDPDLEPGDYVLEVTGTIESKISGRKPWFKISCVVVESTNPACPPGMACSIRYCTSQESESSSFPKIKAWAMACVGVAPNDDAAYDAMEEEQGTHRGGFIDDATLGGQTFVGSRFAARAYHGKPDGNGGYYNEYIFAVDDTAPAT